MASIGGIKMKKRYISNVSDGFKGDNIEYVEPFYLGKVEVLQYRYDDFENTYWVHPEYKNHILNLSKSFFEKTGRSMVMPVPSNPDYQTEYYIEEAYIMSLIAEIKMLNKHEKGFKKALKEGYSAVGYANGSVLKGYKGDISNIKQQMDRDYVASCWRYFSLNDFNLFSDFKC